MSCYVIHMHAPGDVDYSKEPLKGIVRPHLRRWGPRHCTPKKAALWEGVLLFRQKILAIVGPVFPPKTLEKSGGPTPCQTGVWPRSLPSLAPAPPMICQVRCDLGMSRLSYFQGLAILNLTDLKILSLLPPAAISPHTGPLGFGPALLWPSRKPHHRPAGGRSCVRWRAKYCTYGDKRHPHSVSRCLLRTRPFLGHRLFNPWSNRSMPSQFDGFSLETFGVHPWVCPAISTYDFWTSRRSLTIGPFKTQTKNLKWEIKMRYGMPWSDTIVYVPIPWARHPLEAGLLRAFCGFRLAHRRKSEPLHPIPVKTFEI